MDPCLVRESISPDDRLVEGNVVAGEPRHEPRRAGELFGLHSYMQAAEVLTACLDRHDDLFEGRVPGPLPQTVHRALDLAGAARNAGERVGYCEAEIVMAVRRHDVVA